MEGDERSRAVLLGLLHALGSGVFRTKLVKLTYLLDEANYRFRGRSLTGFDYTWDHYGPNAEDNAIVRLLDELITDGLVSMTTSPVPPNAVAHTYQATDRLDPSVLPLSGHDWAEIQTAVSKYRSMNRDQIVRESKKTGPMQNASQYDRLEFKQDPSLQITDEEITADPFLQETLKAATAWKAARSK